MSATTTGSGGRQPTGEAETERCTQCASPLAEDQEWCLECGSSRTLIYPPPDWRIPVAAVAVVILLALAGFVFALSRLSSASSPTGSRGGASASVSSPRVSTGTRTRATGRTTAPAGSAGPASAGTASAGTASAGTASVGTASRVDGIGAWPIGQSGWTVAIESFGREAQAYARARHVLAAYKLHVGVLDSSDHPAMAPGAWILFFGRYTSRGDAAAAAARLVGRGYTQARAVRVARPGGL